MQKQTSKLKILEGLNQLKRPNHLSQVNISSNIELKITQKNPIMNQQAILAKLNYKPKEKT